MGLKRSIGEEAVFSPSQKIPKRPLAFCNFDSIPRQRALVKAIPESLWECRLRPHSEDRAPGHGAFATANVTQEKTKFYWIPHARAADAK